MARWKVTAKHYIHAEQYGQPTEWERQEINQNTQRMFRKAYKVPLFIDPEDPQCINRHEGFCVVARKGTDKPGDIVFFGPPTPDMEPMDDEAQVETDAERHKWIDPINSLPMEIGAEAGQSILRSIEQQIMSAGLSGTAQSLRGTSNTEMQSLKDMAAKQQEMINQLMLRDQPPSAPVVDPIPPDPDPDAIPTPPPLKVDRPRPTARRM